jgi:hypothetical protein
MLRLGAMIAPRRGGAVVVRSRANLAARQEASGRNYTVDRGEPLYDEVAEPECRTAQVLEAPIDRLGGAVAGAGTVGVGPSIWCSDNLGCGISVSAELLPRAAGHHVVELRTRATLGAIRVLSPPRDIATGDRIDASRTIPDKRKFGALTFQQCH